jgi:hypothetical protein
MAIHASMLKRISWWDISISAACDNVAKICTKESKSKIYRVVTTQTQNDRKKKEGYKFNLKIFPSC